MKEETRILLSRCSRDFCIALILRGHGIDGAIAGKDCNEICMKARDKGYLGELRLSEGPCTCGLQEYPGAHKPGAMLLDKVLAQLKTLQELCTLLDKGQ
ncbi:MAG: hypothetical protein GSR86_01790 [Desulfurococcales archaeon]|nr:hypothetical protein [Desulfurococcales archaeon]